MNRTTKVLVILFVMGILENAYSNTTYVANVGVIYIMLVLILNWKRISKEWF